jgi:hypothetical protein
MRTFTQLVDNPYKVDKHTLKEFKGIIVRETPDAVCFEFYFRAQQKLKLWIPLSVCWVMKDFFKDESPYAPDKIQIHEWFCLNRGLI